jgi:hypothetical protein
VGAAGPKCILKKIREGIWAESRPPTFVRQRFLPAAQGTGIDSKFGIALKVFRNQVASTLDQVEKPIIGQRSGSFYERGNKVRQRAACQI